MEAERWRPTGSIDRGIRTNKPRGSRLVEDFKRRFEALLYILYLFAHLLDQHFKLDGYFGHFLVGRFGAQGIGFTVQFLH